MIVTHPDGLQSQYAHMGRIFVKAGQAVTPTNTLGEVGLTGRTSGPHTHLEVSKDGRLIDPLTILPSIADYPDPKYLNSVGGPEMAKILKPDFN